MSFWDQITGKAAADSAQQAGTDYSNQIKQSYGQAQGQYKQGRQAVRSNYQQGRQALRQGQTSAVGALQSSRDAALASNQQGINAVQDYGQQGAQAIQQGTSQAVNALSPYAQSGMGAQTMYMDALGVNGADAQNRYVSGYQADPSQGYVQESILKRMNAAGYADSGASRLAAARAHNEAYNDRLRMLQGAGAQGQQAAGQIGNWQYGAGMALDNNARGTGAAVANMYGQRAGIDQQYGQSASNVYTGTAQNMANSYQGQGNALNANWGTSAQANQAMGDRLAGNYWDTANAVNQANAAGTNNLLSMFGNAVGTAVTGFSPTASGTSAFGNAYNWWNGGGV